MRSMRLAQKERELIHIIEMFRLKRNSHNNNISDGYQNQKKEQVSSCQASPKIFINSQQALVWIKRDVNKKTKHQILQQIKRNAEKQLVINKQSFFKSEQSKKKRSFVQNLRKNGSTSRISKDFNTQVLTKNKVQQLSIKRIKAPFFNIKVVEPLHVLPRPSIKMRIKTEKSRNQRDSYLNQKKQQNVSLTNRNTVKLATERKKTSKNMLYSLQECASASQQYLSPW